MPNSDKTIVGIDIGSNKITTVVAEADAAVPGRFTVLGVGVVASEGVVKGMITDIVKATGAIAHSLEAAERQSGCHILSAYVSISGNHIASTNSRGMVATADPDRIIGQEDVLRAIEAAKATSAVSSGRDLIHVIPRSYTVDGQEGIMNPVGLTGYRLEVETHVITGATNVRENLIRCVQKADVEVDDLILASVAAAESVLTEQEKSLGVALVDIGHGTTDIAIYVEGSVWHTKVLATGGWHIANDLVTVLNIPYEAAEDLKLKFGRATIPASGRSNGHVDGVQLSTAANEAAYAHVLGGPTVEVSPLAVTTLERSGAYRASMETVEVETFDGSKKAVERSHVDNIIAARLEHTLELIYDEIRRSGYEGLLPAGIVLTGGTASIEGLDRLAERKLRLPVRVGRPHRVEGLSGVFEGPGYAASTGLIRWGAKQGGSVPVSVDRASARTARGQGPNLLAKWLRKFLPSG